MDQALPNQFPDLGTLFQHMPAIGAMQAGTQQRIAEQNNQSLQNAFSNEQGFLNQKRPLDLQSVLSHNRSRDANTDQTIEQTRGFKLGNDYKEAVQPGQMSAENAINKTKVSTAELQELDNMGQLFGQVSARMATAPPPMRAAIAKRMLAKYVPDNPEFDSLMVTNADQLPQYFKDMADNIYNMSKSARESQMREERELTKEKMRNASHEKIAQIQSDSRVDVAKTRQQGSGGGATSEAEAVSKMGYEKAAVYYDAKASEAEQSGNAERAEMYRAKADMMKMARERDQAISAMANQGGKIDVGAATDLPTKPELKPEGFNRGPKVGDIIKGHRYKGGNPADKNNWEKI